jgi:choline dehydrogenase-like flavoprotein
VLQGMCVGGGTTVNNALCLDPPGEVLDAWERDHGISRSALEGAIAEVRRFLPVGPIHEAATTSIAARRFAEAAFRLGLPGRVELMEVNISERCLGCGYCNIGCAYGAKLSMLDTALPWAQRDYDRLDVLPEFEVTRIVHEGDRAVAVEGRHADGDAFMFSADLVAVAAGAIHSSHLLQRSEIGGTGPGRGLHFNINSPLTAEFPEPVDAFAGLQMSHAYVPGDGIPGYLVETWFNPPATQALSMPGWFGQHFENMRRYRYMAAGGALVGTTSPGRVTATRKGFKLDYTPSRTDLHRLVEGLKVMGRIFLAAGAQRVMPATYAWHEFRDAASLDDLDRYVRDNADLLLTTAHPQGGNAIGDVVDPDFRVRGFRNLYVCDASVFPTSVHVNPQLTVMGMAELAASRIVSSP